MDGLIKFVDEGSKILENIYNTLENIAPVDLESFDSQNTALIVMDMINGFARQGALKSDRVEKLIPEVEKLSRACDKKNIIKIAFYDSHCKESSEFDSYPMHCIKGTFESEMVEELKEIENFKLIGKNSTNGFLEKKFQKWLKENTEITNFIVVGDCTDICVLQFALSLIAYGNMSNKRFEIIVPMNGVDTFDLEMHNAEFMNYISFYIMISNGIKIVKSIGID